MRARAVVWLLIAVGALASWPVRGARGQELAIATRSPRFLYASSAGATPKEIDARSTAALRRVVALQVDEPTVGRLLATIERQTGLTFAYGNDFRVDRPVTLRADSITVASALAAILYDAGVDVVLSPGGHVALVKREEVLSPTVGSINGKVTDAKTRQALAGATVVVQGTSRSATTSSDGRYRIADVAPGTYTLRARYIGYAPGSVSVTVSADQEATADLALEKSAQRLDEVVTTGTVVPTEVKALPTPISVVTADDIQRQNLQRVDQVFRGSVPGTIAWDLGPIGYYSNVTVRGASTLSDVPSIKTFVDGVEMTSPTFLANIDPNSIDRIEITRGPQASTLYGAGALNGVMQIFTKKGQLGLSRPEITGKVSVGGVGGWDGQKTALQTDNAISVLGGGEKTSYSLGGSYRHTGEWVASYHLTDWSMFVAGQTTQGPLTLSSSMRYADKSMDEPWDTRLQAFSSYYSVPPYLTDHVRQQTYGVTANLQATPSWRHTATLGYDQNYYNYYNPRPRFTTPADSFLSYNPSHAAKTSLLYHTDVSLRLGAATSASVTAGVNYDMYDAVGFFSSRSTRTSGNLNGRTTGHSSVSSNTGYFGQVQIGFAERLFLTGGLRAERNPYFGANFGTAWSPRVGASYVLGLGAATVKVRASYGESIRPPAPGQRDAQVFSTFQYLANPALAPERQRGVDGGMEIYLGRTSLGVTYYNQRAINLIQSIDVAPHTQQFQNIARVKNDGWEFEAHVPLGPVQLVGTYSIVNSTVLADSTQTYIAGDPILGVPHTTAGATVTYSPVPETTLTATLTYIGHWVENDYLALYPYYYGLAPYRGSDRAYWMEYPGVAKFAVGVNQVVARNVTAFVRAENVGNNLRFEQYNLNIPTPRSVVVGVNVRY